MPSHILRILAERGFEQVGIFRIVLGTFFLLAAMFLLITARFMLGLLFLLIGVTFLLVGYFWRKHARSYAETIGKVLGQ